MHNMVYIFLIWDKLSNVMYATVLRPKYTLIRIAKAVANQHPCSMMYKVFQVCWFTNAFTKH